MTIQEEKRLSVAMWREIANRIREGRIRNIYDINEFKMLYLRDLKINWPSNCILCHYFNSCYECPLYTASNNNDCGDPNNYYYKLKFFGKERQINYNYKDDELEKFASYAEKIADVIQSLCISTLTN